jgi:hypothetical protein
MQTDQLVFVGTETEQQVAREVWLALRMLGMNFADNAPIRQPLPALAGFFGRHPALAGVADAASVIDQALSKNDAIFAREVTDDGVVAFVTTRSGRPPVTAESDHRHTFRTRLTQPAPVPTIDRPAEPAARVGDGWLRPSQEAEAVVEPEPEPEPVEVEAPEVESEPPVAVAPVAAVPAAASAVETPAPAVAPETPAVTPVVEAPPAVPDMPLDVLAAALRERLAADVRLASFGDEWSLDDMALRLSRNDFRRIRDYMTERQEPLTDEELLNDVLGRRVTDRDYQLNRFGLNVRMSKEKKDFDFVGTAQSRLWSTSALPPIGTAKRKPAELGQDYRFLLESKEEIDPASLGSSIDHTLTFYEYEYGLLPLDAHLAAFFPRPYLEEQRTAILRFDVPQLYSSYLIELRYPTANRGGFLSGLDQFYAENLVPGAVLTIERTDNDGRYVLRFGQTAAQERRLLHVDERRGRYVFRPVTFYCVVNEDMLLSDTKFGGLNNAKILDDREKRRPEAVLRATFERVGDQVGDKSAPRYWALADDLLAAANVERPFTAEYVRQVLESPNHPEFSVDPEGNAYFYDPNAIQ